MFVIPELLSKSTGIFVTSDEGVTRDAESAEEGSLGAKARSIREVNASIGERVEDGVTKEGGEGRRVDWGGRKLDGPGRLFM